MTTLYELSCKYVVDIKTGRNLGRPSDVQFIEHTARITAIIIYGKLKFCGLFGRNEDVVVPWKNIVVIGDDVILVDTHDLNWYEHRKGPHDH